MRSSEGGGWWRWHRHGQNVAASTGIEDSAAMTSTGPADRTLRAREGGDAALTDNIAGSPPRWCLPQAIPSEADRQQDQQRRARSRRAPARRSRCNTGIDCR